MVTEVKVEVNNNKYLVDRIEKITNDLLCKSNNIRYIFINSKGKISWTENESFFEQHNFKEIDPIDFIMSNGEQEWLPKYGEKVEFSDNKINWYENTFKAYIPNTISTYVNGDTDSYRYCGPINQTKTIIIDNKEIEISNECFESLKKQLLGNKE